MQKIPLYHHRILTERLRNQHGENPRKWHTGAADNPCTRKCPVFWLETRQDRWKCSKGRSIKRLQCPQDKHLNQSTHTEGFFSFLIIRNKYTQKCFPVKRYPGCTDDPSTHSILLPSSFRTNRGDTRKSPRYLNTISINSFQPFTGTIYRQEDILQYCYHIILLTNQVQEDLGNARRSLVFSQGSSNRQITVVWDIQVPR